MSLSRDTHSEQRSNIAAAGAALVAQARREYPTSGRCVHCGFRGPYHEPANHPYEMAEHSFVKALREFVEAVSR